MIIALDFDGTLVRHEYPNVGTDLGAGVWLRAGAEIGAKYILFTMRDGQHLADAVSFCKEELGIELYGVNTHPTQKNWTMSPKAYSQLYIDDTALGIPLDYEGNVDWSIVGPMMLIEIQRKGLGNPIKNSARFL